MRGFGRDFTEQFLVVTVWSLVLVVAVLVIDIQPTYPHYCIALSIGHYQCDPSDDVS